MAVFGLLIDKENFFRPRNYQFLCRSRLCPNFNSFAALVLVLVLGLVLVLVLVFVVIRQLH